MEQNTYEILNNILTGMENITKRIDFLTKRIKTIEEILLTQASPSLISCSNCVDEATCNYKSYVATPYCSFKKKA